MLKISLLDGVLANNQVSGLNTKFLTLKKISIGEEFSLMET